MDVSKYTNEDYERMTMRHLPKELWEETLDQVKRDHEQLVS